MNNQTLKARRQTLGPVNVNSLSGDEKGHQHFNRRQSVDPSLAPPPKSRPPKGRASMIPRVGRENLIPRTPSTNKPIPPTSGSARRQSLSSDRRQSMALPVAIPSKTDPRNLSDKKFQQDCVRSLHKFLVDHGYDHPITHKSLSRPSGKDFNHIVCFLFRKLDPNFQDGTMKLEDEVSMNFRALGYPFPVSKTSLVAAGSPHAWPALLAALTWLMERLICLEDTTDDGEGPQSFESLEELEIKTDKAFFKYLSASYSAFLRGDESITEELEVQLAEQFEKDDEIIEREIEQMTEKNAIILEQINDIAVDENDLIEYTRKRQSYETDLAQFHDLIDQMENHVKMLEQKKTERKSELEVSNLKLDEMTKRVDKVRSSIEQQKLTPEDAKAISNSLRGVNESLDRFLNLNTEKKEDLSSVNDARKGLWFEVEEKVDSYNARSRDLHDFLPNECNELTKAGSGDFVFYKSTDLQECEDVARKELESSQDDVQSRLRNQKQEYQAVLDSLAECEGQLAGANQQEKVVHLKLQTRNETRSEEEAAALTKLEFRNAEASSIEAKIASTREPVLLEKKLSDFVNRRAELEACRLKLNDSNATRLKALFLESERAMFAIEDFECFLPSMMKEVGTYRSNTVHELPNGDCTLNL